jgi:hypothetical protein
MKGFNMATKRDVNTTFKASCSDSNYVSKAMSEFTIMNNEELQNWEQIQKALKEGRLRTLW